MTPNTRPAEGRTSPQETKLAGNGETVADEAVERAAVSPGAIEEASGEWVVLDPAGKEVARERSCARAWARVRGTYKTTVEGMAGLEEAGWRVIPLALDEETFVRERLAKLLAETVVALRGPEPPLTRWGYHDIPQQVAALLAERDALRGEVERLRADMRPRPEHACLTIDDWRMAAWQYETEWGRCSDACARMQTRAEAAESALAAERAEVVALHSLLNVYNLGGWTDALEPMKRALAAESAFAAERELAEANARDARRYAWLRDNCNEGFMRYWAGGWTLNCDEPASEWDAAIDAALAAQEGK